LSAADDELTLFFADLEIFLDAVELRFVGQRAHEAFGGAERFETGFQALDEIRGDGFVDEEAGGGYWDS
jgi:hypothetical protein